MEIFVPDSYVPLGEFKLVDETSASASEWDVRVEILEWLTQNNAKLLAACRCPKGEVHYSEVKEIDVVSGIARASTRRSGVYTLVSDAFRNDYPIVTNWDGSLNGGRGGPREGGSDGIGLLRYNPATGGIATESDLSEEDPESPFMYKTDRYALFEGETDGLHASVPGYERYIGETYSLYGVSEEAAVWLSDLSIKLTGYPVMMRNDIGDEPSAVIAGVPVFQLVSGRIVETRSEHRSVASFILPPFWKREPDSPYPILFSAYYDLNQSAFLHIGPPFLVVIAQALGKTGKGAIGVIGNGGGSVGTRTLQRSVLANFADLFRIAQRRYAGDPEAVVAVGYSRGAIAGMLAAANTDYDNYKVPYLICYNLPMFYEESPETMLSTTYPARWEAFCADIGYRDAWRQDWKAPDGKTTVESFLHNQFGTSDVKDIRENRSPMSDRMLRSLRDKGTKVLFHTGTHDVFSASWPAFQWVNKAREFGVPVRHEIGYRFGHNNCTNLYDYARECLIALQMGTDYPMEGTVHYRRADESADDWSRAVPFDPGNSPVFLEAPKVAIAGMRTVFVLYGEQGMEYRLRLLHDEEGDNSPYEIMEGTLPFLEECEGTFSFQQHVTDMSSLLSPAEYRYDLQYRRRMDREWTTGSSLHVPQPCSEKAPKMILLAEMPTLIGEQWHQITEKHAIGWGLSEH